MSTDSVSTAATPPRHPRLRRELVIFGVSLALGFLLLPLLTWFVGQFFLGPYQRDPTGTTGGAVGLWVDFLRALLRGQLSAWVLALGPYGLWWLWRASRWFWKR